VTTLAKTPRLAHHSGPARPPGRRGRERAHRSGLARRSQLSPAVLPAPTWQPDSTLANRAKIAMIEREAAARNARITILADFIHVLEYLWKAGWAFHRPRDPALEAWVTAQGTEILHGRTRQVIALIEALALEHPPAPGSEHEKQIRRTLSYLTSKLPYLNYPQALASGWPIATGVIEGACRHLVADRLGITGAR
jgi:hypothetical protein